MDLVERASAFARQAHASQQYAGGSFHEKHLGRVVATLQEFGETDEIKLAAAWLHDTVEDTEVTVDDIRRQFGHEVADLVWRLTDEEGGSRRERHAKTHAKIRQRPEAVRVKLADRIANVESAMEQRSNLFGMYRSEHAQFRAQLYREGEWEEMWARLDKDLKTGKSETSRVEGAMSDHVYKIVELTGSSHTGMEDAIRNAVERAGKTLHNLRWFEVCNTRGHIDGNKVAHWQVTLKVGFTLDE